MSDVRRKSNEEIENRLDDLEVLIGLNKTAYIKDVKPNGTDGGTFNSGAWRTRDLNTLSGETSFVSLSSNQFTLEPGKYKIVASAPAYRTRLHKAKIRNITDSVDEIIGSTELADDQVTGGAAVETISRSFVVGEIDISSSKTFELQHRGENNSGSGFGFGIASSFGVDEVYSQIEITKVGN